MLTFFLCENEKTSFMSGVKDGIDWSGGRELKNEMAEVHGNRNHRMKCNILNSKVKLRSELGTGTEWGQMERAFIWE